MAEAVIPVDLFNPGQVFACLGFIEAADILLGGAQGGFDWSNEVATRFHISAAGDEDPVRAVLTFLAEAEVSVAAPPHSALSVEKQQIPTRYLAPGEPYPFPEPSSPATLPAVLSVPGRPPIVIDYWADATRRDNVKFWGGSGGYSGAARARDALALVRDRLPEAAQDPFALAAPQSSSFRLDWRRDYIPIDSGFSPNRHSGLAMVGYPLVEILAAIGLANARPQRLDKLLYRYAVIAPGQNGTLLAPLLLRAALGCAELPFPRRRFQMRLGWPAQENQERCIIDVIEEPSP